MGALFVYVPARFAHGDKSKLLESFGLGRLVADRGPTAIDVLNSGPDDANGILCHWMQPGDPSSATAGVVKGKQTWYEAPAGEDREKGRYWLGWYTASPPGPSDLAVTEQFGGGWVQLGDDKEWLIPATRRLSHRASLDPETGKFARVPKDRYASFCKRAASHAHKVFSAVGAFDAYLAQNPKADPEDYEVECSLEDAWDYCCEALSINYRVTPEIIDALKLFDDQKMLAVMMQTVELVEILETQGQKKTEKLRIPVTSTSLSGSTE